MTTARRAGTLALMLCVFAGVLLTGCPAGKHMPAERTNPAGVLGEGKKKEDGIKAEAEGIIGNPTDSAFVSASAERILDILRLSPWAKTEATIKALVSERDAALKGGEAKDAQIAKLQKDLREMKDAFHNWFRRGCYVVGALVMALGVASFFFLGQIASFSPWLAARMGPMISLSVFAFGATILATGIAYGYALEHKTTVFCILGAAGLAAAVYFHGNHHREKSPNDIKA